MPRALCCAILMCFGLTARADAQGIALNLPAFAHLRSQATDAVDIDLGPMPLRLAGWLIDDHDSESAEAKSLLAGLRELQVRHYEFAADFVYSQADIDAVREQLSGPGWSRVAHVRNQKDGEDVDIYLALDRERIKGVAIVASEPREFTIVNAVGSLDPAQVAALRRHFELHHDAVARAHGPSLPF